MYMSNTFEEKLKSSPKLHVQQVQEAFEILTGFESRNKYRIYDENMTPIAYAAEKSTGLTGTLMRGLFRHWRKFEIQIFSQDRQLLYVAKFPFRWFFKTLQLEDASGCPIGHFQQRFAIFHKKFDLHDPHKKLIAQIESPWFKFWTFEFKLHKHRLGTIQKKWSGALSEFFTDKDNFTVSFADRDLDGKTKVLMMASCLMVDIVYFENNKGAGSALNLAD